jgi:hypothetical protein
VLCVDEKSQIQALDRTAPTLPMLPGTPVRATHDYKRNGTSGLFAALELTTGKVIGRLHSRHRAIEFKKFPQTIDQEVPAELDVHLILDNYSTHKTPAIRRWLAAHPRFVLHFTPTGASWLNLVERWFAELTASAGSLPSSAGTYSPSASVPQAAGRSRPRSHPPLAAPRSHPSQPRPDTDPSASPHLTSFVSEIADSPRWCGDSLRPPDGTGIVQTGRRCRIVRRAAASPRVPPRRRSRSRVRCS